MTVEKWLRGQFQGIGEQLEADVLAVAADSPGDINDPRFRALSLSEDKDNYIGDEVFANSLQYALSTLLYAMSSATSTGSRSEKRGNRQVTRGGHSFTTRDREAFRNRADRIRQKFGLDIEEPDADEGGMDDYTYKFHKPNITRRWQC